MAPHQKERHSNGLWVISLRGKKDKLHDRFFTTNLKAQIAIFVGHSPFFFLTSQWTAAISIGTWRHATRPPRLFARLACGLDLRLVKLYIGECTAAVHGHAAMKQNDKQCDVKSDITPSRKGCPFASKCFSFDFHITGQDGKQMQANQANNLITCPNQFITVNLRQWQGQILGTEWAGHSDFHSLGPSREKRTPGG